MPAKPYGDGIDYEAIAFSLVETGEFRIDTTSPRWRQPYERYPEVYAEVLSQQPRNQLCTGRPPLVPFFIANIYWLLGRNEVSFAAVRIAFAVMIAVAQGVSVALVVWYAHRLFRALHRLGFGEGWTVVAGGGLAFLLAGVHRTVSDYATDFLTEPVALLLTQVFVLSAVGATVRTGSADSAPVVSGGWPGQWLVVGVLFGLMILARSIFIVWLPGVVLLAALAQRPHRSQVAKAVAGIVGGVVFVCCPWWVRNCVVLESAMPLGTQGTIALMGGYSDAARDRGGEWQHTAELELREEMGRRPEFLAASGEQREVMLAREARRRVGEWVGEHWSDLPAMFARRVITHWNPYDAKTLGWRLLTAMGAIEVLRRGAGFRIWLIGIPAISTLVAAGLYSVGGRFLVPCYGVLYALAGLSVFLLVRTEPRSGSLPSASPRGPQ